MTNLKTKVFWTLGLAYVIDRIFYPDKYKKKEPELALELNDTGHQYASTWDEKTFQKWLKLREKFGTYKKAQNWRDLIGVGTEIIELAKNAEFIGIMVPLFYKDMAYAYAKMGEISNAVNHYQMAKDGLIKYRSEERLASPDDWLDTIGIIDRKISKLMIKKA